MVSPEGNLNPENYNCLKVLLNYQGAVRTWDILLLIPQMFLFAFFTVKKFYKFDSTGNSYTKIYKTLIYFACAGSLFRAILSLVRATFFLKLFIFL